MKFTHMKKIYRAICYRITQDNLARMQSDFSDIASVEHYQNGATVRYFAHRDDRLDTKHVVYGTAWVRIGENKIIKIIENYDFNDKYVRVL